MLVRVNLVGDGSTNNPYRANLPTYQEVHSNISQGYAIVRIPEADFHVSSDKLDAKTEQTTEGPLIIGLSDEQHAQWHEHLDKRYAAHKGEFRPHVV